MKLKTLAIFAALAGFSGTLLAEAGKPVMVDPEPICDVPFEGTVSFGYESVYLFRGADFGDNAPWAGLDLTGSVAGLEVNVGAWYINTIEDPVAFDELDLYLFVTGPSFGPFDTSIGGTWFYFAEIDDEAGEVEFDIFVVDFSEVEPGSTSLKSTTKLAKLNSTSPPRLVLSTLL